MGTATENFAFNEQLTLSVNALGGDAHTTGAEQSTRIDSLGGGFQWQPTERASVQGSVGLSRQTTAGLTSNTVIGQLSASYSTELSNFTVGARSASCNRRASECLLQVDQGSFTATRELSERVTLDSEAQLYRTPAHSFAVHIVHLCRPDVFGVASATQWQQTPA